MPTEMVVVAPDGRTSVVTKKAYELYLKKEGWRIQGQTEVALPIQTVVVDDEDEEDQINIHEAGEGLPKGPVEEEDELDADFAALMDSREPPKPARKKEKS